MALTSNAIASENLDDSLPIGFTISLSSLLVPKSSMESQSEGMLSGPSKTKVSAVRMTCKRQVVCVCFFFNLLRLNGGACLSLICASSTSGITVVDHTSWLFISNDGGWTLLGPFLVVSATLHSTPSMLAHL